MLKIFFIVFFLDTKDISITPMPNMLKCIQVMELAKTEIPDAKVACFAGNNIRFKLDEL